MVKNFMFLIYIYYHYFKFILQIQLLIISERNYDKQSDKTSIQHIKEKILTKCCLWKDKEKTVQTTKGCVGWTI